MQNLSDNAILMRASFTLCSKHRKDKAVTAEVTAQKGIQPGTGSWNKDLYPKGSLDAIASKQNEARAYHTRTTLPFGTASEDEDGATDAVGGIGILPAALVVEYGEKMRQFSGELAKLRDDFCARAEEWVKWAMMAHNGTFEPANYPGCEILPDGTPKVDLAVFRDKVGRKIGMKWEVVPFAHTGAAGIADKLAAVLGVDPASVDVRVADAERQARVDLMARLMAPVAEMAKKLVEQPKAGKDDIIFRDTLVGNIADICKLAPALNMTGDAEIDRLVGEVEKLTRYAPDTLRADKTTRAEAANLAAETLKRLSGYQL